MLCINQLDMIVINKKVLNNLFAYTDNKISLKEIKMSYARTINTLLDLLALASKANTNKAESWQKPEDAKAFYGHIAEALKSIDGENIYNIWVENIEVLEF